MRGWGLIVGVLLLVPGSAFGGLDLTPGLSAEVYVTGEGFDSTETRGARGIPAVSTLAFDSSGVLYLARSGRRYIGGEVEDLSRLYRIPPGGARLTRQTEERHLHAPPFQ